jgi:dihydrofolate reductase
MLTVTFVTDGIESAIAKAKAAASDKNVILIGASVNQQCINAGLCDELHIGIMPVLLGSGLRMFEHIDVARVALEKIRIFESGARTDIWFRVTQTSH